MQEKISIDFSLALHNRTGKYFIGRDVIEDLSARIGKIVYWGARFPHPPSGYTAKFLGRALTIHDRIVEKFPARFFRFSDKSPVLHLDPSTVVHYRLKHDDVVLCHDLGPITHPELFHPKVADLYQRAYLQIADAQPGMVFVSEASRREFTRLYGPLPDMAVIYPALRDEFDQVAPTPPSVIPDKFLLSVGSIGVRKNHSRMIAAFAESGLAALGWTYVICGAREPGADEVEKLAAATPGVSLRSYVPDGELAWLYQNARGFMLVSSLEGFGVPVAEAISYGLIPIITRDSVLEEVAGPGALSADAQDVADISRAILKLVELGDIEAAERRQMLKASIARFSRARFRAEWRQLFVKREIEALHR